MKKITIGIIALLLFIPSIAFGENKLKALTKTAEFETTDYNFEYQPQDTITEDGITYVFKSIAYEKISEEDLFIEIKRVITREVEQIGLLFQDDSAFEKTLYDAEEEMELPLKEIIYTESLLQDRTGEATKVYDYGLQSTKPSSPATLDILYKDELTGSTVLVTLDFVRLDEKGQQWNGNLNAEQSHRSAYEDECILSNGIRLSFASETPEYEGFESQLLEQMRLNPDTNRIIGSKWAGEAITESGQTVRVADYTVHRLETEYEAVYSGKFELPDMLTYDGVAIYETEITEQAPNGKNYTVNAIITYEEKQAKKNYTPVIAGATGGVIGLCGLVLFLIKRREKLHEEE